MYKLREWFGFFNQAKNNHQLVEDAIQAIKSRDTNGLNNLLEIGVNPNSRNKKGFSLIHLAVLHARLEEEDEVLDIIETLVRHGGNVNAIYEKDNYGALTTAVRRKLPTIVGYLLKEGADPNLTIINHHKSAYDYAAEFTDDRGKLVLEQFSIYKVKRFE